MLPNPNLSHTANHCHVRKCKGAGKNPVLVRNRTLDLTVEESEGLPPCQMLLTNVCHLLIAFIAMQILP